MAFEYQGFATLGVNLNRQKYGPLDISNVFTNTADLAYYTSKGASKDGVSEYWLKVVPYPYAGQVVALVGADRSVQILKLIENEDGTFTTAEVGKIPLGDNATIDVTSEGVISIKGFTGAAEGAQLTKTKNGLEWIVPSTETVDDLQDDVAELQELVGKEAIPGTSPASGLYLKLSEVDYRLDSAISSHESNKQNPHSVTAEQVGLGNVTNDAQVKRTEMGVAGGVATLDDNGHVPAAQLPSYVDDVIEAETFDALPAEGEAGKIYVVLTGDEAGKTYRWSGTTYVVISDSIALGETTGTAYDGAKGKAATEAINTHIDDGDVHITADERSKLANIEVNAEVNIVDSVENTEFTLTDRKLSVKEIDQSKVTGLTDELALKATNADLEALEDKVDNKQIEEYFEEVNEKLLGSSSYRIELGPEEKFSDYPMTLKIIRNSDNKTIIFKEDDDDITIDNNAGMTITNAMSSPKLESIGIAYLGIYREEDYYYIEFLTPGTEEVYTIYDLETTIVKLLDEKYIDESIARATDLQDAVAAAIDADEKVILQKYTVEADDPADAKSFTVHMVLDEDYSFVEGSLAKVIVNTVTYIVEPAESVTVNAGFGLDTSDDVHVEFREVKTVVNA